MDHHAGRITIIASSTMVHQRVRCMICDQPVDHRVVFMTNDARVLHAGCIPDHVKVPTTVLLQAIRRLERMVAKARGEDGAGPSPHDPAAEDRDPEPGGSEPGGSESESSVPEGSLPGGSEPGGSEDPDLEPGGGSEDRDPEPGGSADESPENRRSGNRGPDPGPGLGPPAP